jgi:protein NRD1
MDYIARYARVQSCIVNHDKRHAFLKLISHQDAINAKQAIDSRPEAEYRHLFERVRIFQNAHHFRTKKMNMRN